MSEQEAIFAQFRNFQTTWLKLALSTQECNQEHAREAANGVYEASGRSRPEIIFMDSPWQLSQAPKLLENCGVGPFTLRNYVEKVARVIREQARVTFKPEEWLVLCGIFFDRNPESPSDVLADTSRLAIGGGQLLPTLAEADRLIVRLTNRLNYEFMTNPAITIDPILWNRLVAAVEVRQRARFHGPLYETQVEWARWDMLRHLLFGEFCRNFLNVCFGNIVTQQLDVLSAMLRCTHAYLNFDNICFISQFPEKLSLDDELRYHNADGPCTSYRDGFELYAWHGTFVPRTAITEEPSVATIEYERNVELRRVLIERYGQEQFLLDAKALKLDESPYGILYFKEFKEGESLVTVKVRNSTPEPDGSHRFYFLRVPPNTRTAREAVAWTFGLDELSYNPTVQT